MVESNVANYTDDTTLYVCKKLSDVQRKLEPESSILFEGTMITTSKLIVVNLISCEQQITN